ncbi:MAG TPA: CHAT domain-containing tetratricopeptide repeat protein [Vicinamibacterales bacterium]
MATRFREVLLAGSCALAVVCCRNAPQAPATPTYSEAESRFQSGDLASALTIAERGVRSTSGPDTTEYWRFLLLQAEASVWQGNNVDALALLASEPPAVGGADVAARRATLQALASNALQRFDDAETYLQTAQGLATRVTPDLAIDIALADGWLGFARKDFDRASRAFELALDRARDRRQPFREVNARGGLGLVEMQRHRFAAAVDWFQSALPVARSIQARASVAKLLGNLGWAYVSMGELDMALQLFTNTRDESERLGVRKDVGISLTNIGFIHENRREFASAESDYRSALEIARALQDKQQIAIILTSLAAVMIARGDVERATGYNDESLQLARAIGDRNEERAGLINSGAIAVSQRRPRDAERFFHDVIDAESLDNPESNLSLRSGADAGLARMYAADGDVQHAQAFFHDALRTMGIARAAVGRDEFKLSTVTLARSIYDDYIDFLMTRGKVVQACAVAETARAQTLKEGLKQPRSAYSEDGERDCPLPKSGIVLAYWLGRERGYLWILRPVGLTAVTLPREDQIAALVDRHTHALMGPRDSVESENSAGIELYDVLAGPAEPWVARDPHVTVIPDGVLCGLNFETLIAPRPEAHYWIKDVTVTQAAALGLSAGLRSSRRPGGTDSPTLLLIGNPVTVSDAYPALTHAAAEIDGVARHFHVNAKTVLVGAAATPTAYANAHPGEFSFIHFVAHGVASRASPLDSVIVLSENGRPAYVYARDIIQTPLNARLVTISACESAGTRTYSGEGLVGLSWAFLRAGAHEVVGALWLVDDASTAQLMESLYEQIGKGQTPADAMRSAKLTMLNSGSIYRKPFYWAAFVLYSGR